MKVVLVYKDGKRVEKNVILSSPKFNEIIESGNVEAVIDFSTAEVIFEK